jgi:hypothetical protein
MMVMGWCAVLLLLWFNSKGVHHPQIQWNLLCLGLSGGGGDDVDEMQGLCVELG